MKERFLGLDALRGVAALAVVNLHFSFGKLPYHGYLAVDVFFVLSGFVIAHAYESRLLNGFGLGRFALARSIRLYPLVWLGVALSVGLSLVLLEIGRGEAFGLVQILFALLLLPYVTGASADMYVVLSPTWSLFNELVVNVAYAATVRFLSNGVLLACCVVSGVALVAATLSHGSVLFGPFKGTLLMGLVRTSFSFCVGILVYRFRGSSFHTGPVVLVTCLAAALALLSVPDLEKLNGAYEALAVAVAIPCLIALTAHMKLDGLCASVAALLGDLSYPVYVIHWPMRGALLLTGIQTKIPELAFLTLSSILVCGCAYVALRLYDEPLRKAMSGRSIAMQHPATAP
jgi:peptidoglycan/LPS O-acetylase OafA/YrhL